MGCLQALLEGSEPAYGIAVGGSYLQRFVEGLMGFRMVALFDIILEALGLELEIILE